MSLLEGRVQGQLASGDLDGVLNCAGGRPGCREGSKSITREPPHMAALVLQPLVEGIRPDTESLEELPAVRLGGVVRIEPLEARHVDLHEVRIERERLPLGGKNRFAENLAQPGDALAQIVTSALLAHVSPQQGRQVIAGVMAAGGKGKVGQKCLRLAPADLDEPAGAIFDAELTEEKESHPLR